MLTTATAQKTTHELQTKLCAPPKLREDNYLSLPAILYLPLRSPSLSVAEPCLFPKIKEQQLGNNMRWPQRKQRETGLSTTQRSIQLLACARSASADRVFWTSGHLPPKHAHDPHGSRRTEWGSERESLKPCERETNPCNRESQKEIEVPVYMQQLHVLSFYFSLLCFLAVCLCGFNCLVWVRKRQKEKKAEKRKRECKAGFFLFVIFNFIWGSEAWVKNAHNKPFFVTPTPTCTHARMHSCGNVRLMLRVLLRR